MKVKRRGGDREKAMERSRERRRKTTAMTRRKKGARDLIAYSAPPFSTASGMTPQPGLQAHSLHRPLMCMPAERNMEGLGGFSDVFP